MPGPPARRRRRCGAAIPRTLFDRDARAWAAGAAARSLGDRLVWAVEAHHRAAPLAAGIGREALRRALPAAVPPRLFLRLLREPGRREPRLGEADEQPAAQGAPRGGAGVVVAGAEGRLCAFLRERQGITTRKFKALVGGTRKHVIPLAEHFDRTRRTLRVGDRRVLRGGSAHPGDAR